MSFHGALQPTQAMWETAEYNKQQCLPSSTLPENLPTMWSYRHDVVKKK